uniref:Uncharacterized protein n=1 Tax=Salix viminalis TaxID=40686 RepID=A0A6N2LYE4_SALVM
MVAIKAGKNSSIPITSSRIEQTSSSSFSIDSLSVKVIIAWLAPENRKPSYCLFNISQNHILHCGIVLDLSEKDCLEGGYWPSGPGKYLIGDLLTANFSEYQEGESLPMVDEDLHCAKSQAFTSSSHSFQHCVMTGKTLPSWERKEKQMEEFEGRHHLVLTKDMYFNANRKEICCIKATSAPFSRLPQVHVGSISCVKSLLGTSLWRLPKAEVAHITKKKSNQLYLILGGGGFLIISGIAITFYLGIFPLPHKPQFNLNEATITGLEIFRSKPAYL